MLLSSKLYFSVPFKKAAGAKGVTSPASVELAAWHAFRSSPDTFVFRLEVGRIPKTGIREFRLFLQLRIRIHKSGIRIFEGSGSL